MWRCAVVAILVASTAAGQNCAAIPGWGSANTQTSLQPVLDPHASGFLSKDVLTVTFHNPKKFDYESATLFENAPGPASEADLETQESPGISAADGSTTGLVLGNDARCYVKHAIRVPWSDYSVGGNLPYLAVVEDLAQRKYRGRVRVVNKETLEDPVRGDILIRDVISELPFELIFPKQVSAVFNNITAYRAPAIAAALIFQEIEVNIHDFDDVDLTLRVFTSVQWPFRIISTDDDSTDAYLHPAVVPISVVDKIDMDPNGLRLVSDCLGISPGDACEQIWRIKGNNKPGVCDLDGSYRLDYKFGCHPFFDEDSDPGGAGDCPLEPDDHGFPSAEISVDLLIDTEHFCPIVVDNIELAGGMDAYKDEFHQFPGKNFQLGTTIFFKLEVSTDSDVSIKHTVLTNVLMILDDVDYTLFYTDTDGNPVTVATDLGFAYKNGFLSGPQATGFVDQVHFSFLLLNPPFNPPEDGAINIDVIATVEVEFEGNTPLLEGGGVRLLAVKAPAHPGSQRARMGESFDFNERVELETLGPSEVETNSAKFRFRLVGPTAATAAATAVGVAVAAP